MYPTGCSVAIKRNRRKPENLNRSPKQCFEHERIKMSFIAPFNLQNLEVYTHKTTSSLIKTYAKLAIYKDGNGE